jgi:hypothetical protein
LNLPEPNPVATAPGSVLYGGAYLLMNAFTKTLLMLLVILCFASVGLAQSPEKVTVCQLKERSREI